MISRRKLLGACALCAVVTALSHPAAAQSWKAQYPELVLAIVPSENASGVTERYKPFVDYLAQEIGTKVTLRVANDYAAVIEGHRAGNIQIGYHGPSSYVRAWTVTNGGVEPFVTTINADKSVGYYSVLYTKASNPASKLEDLKGTNLCLVDPNSASGNNVPRYSLSKRGIDPDTFFSKVVYAGSHENAVMALEQGTCDATFNWWNSETDSNLTRMANKKMVKLENFKTVFRSDLIAGSPYIYLSSLPAELKAAISKAFLDAPTKAKEAYDKLSDGKDLGFHPVTNKDYADTLELQKFVDNLRRKRS